jgi:hypothetical protein
MFEPDPDIFDDLFHNAECAIMPNWAVRLAFLGLWLVSSRS